MPERKCRLKISETLLGKSSGQASLKEGMGGNMGKRDKCVKKFRKAEKKWKRELKNLKKQKKLYIAW